MELRNREVKSARDVAIEPESPGGLESKRDGVLMAKMGKKQQLNVRVAFPSFWPNNVLLL